MNTQGDSGGPADGSDSIYRAPESETRFAPQGDALSAYVGPKNADYYRRRFDRIKAGASVSWHWPAFFVTGYWLLYRKMWLYAFLYWLVLPLALGVISGFIGVATESPGSTALLYYGSYGFIGFLLMPMFANRLYYGHAQAKVDKVRTATASPDQQAAELARIGGTNVIAPIAVFAVLFLGGVVVGISIPAYQDYTIRAQVAEGINLSRGAQAAVTEYYESTGGFAADNEEAGMPQPEALSGNYVASVAIYDGAIVVTYGNQANDLIRGASLELLPEGYPDGRIEWTCSSPDIRDVHLPSACR